MAPKKQHITHDLIWGNHYNQLEVSYLLYQCIFHKGFLTSPVFSQFKVLTSHIKISIYIWYWKTKMFSSFDYRAQRLIYAI